ncbi:MAG: FtsQ-type POTRA domain-containing protein [Tissierellia bacterium]|nr:FtsQ-type POTRA domain-containing protein [Tissierellia bacterium]
MTDKKIVKKRRKKRRKIKYFRIFFLLAIFLGICYFILNLGLFKISKIDVMGNKKVETEAILEKTDYLMGKSIFFTRKSTVEKSVKSIPYVDTVKVKKKFPSKVELTVEERKPSIMIPNKDKFLLIDSTGTFLEEVESFTYDLTIIEKIDLNGDPKSGDKIFDFIVDDRIDNFLELALSKSVFSYFEKLHFDEKETVIDLNNGIKVAFGSYNNMEYKLDVLQKILDDVEKDGTNATMILMEEGPYPVLVTDFEKID